MNGEPDHQRELLKFIDRLEEFLLASKKLVVSGDDLLKALRAETERNGK